MSHVPSANWRMSNTAEQVFVSYGDQSCVLQVFVTHVCVLQVFVTHVCVLQVFVTHVCVLQVFVTHVCVLQVFVTHVCVLQVFVSYGDQSNDSLLQYYGFTEEDNPGDALRFEFYV